MNVPSLPLRLEGLRFKGDRDYLHGTDLLPAALHALSGERPLSAIHDIDITFHALARAGLTLQAEAPTGQEARAQLGCTIDGRRLKLFLVEDGRPITERRAYPEDRIVALTSIDAGSRAVTSTASMPFTNIERWIAMTKALHHEVFPDAGGKWLFVRGKFDAYLDTQGDEVEHRVGIQSDFGGKLTRASLSVGGQGVGEIFFALA